MKRDDVIRMARESGWAQKDIDSLLYIVETAAAAERAACSDICDQHASIEGIAQRCADAIRARGHA